jgi:hypothetical protein
MRLALRFHPAVAPIGHRNNNGVKLQAFIGEAILMSRRALLICDRDNDAKFLEALEPIGEGAGRDTGVRLQDFKAT